MLPIHFAPHPALLEFINSVFVFDIDFRAGTGLSPIYPFVPSPNRFLCFFLHDQVKMSKGPGQEFIQRARSVIIGPQLAPVTLDLGQQHQAVVVCLKPAGMYRLLGIPMAELVDCDCDARLVIGREVDEESLYQPAAPDWGRHQRGRRAHWPGHPSGPTCLRRPSAT